MRTKVLLVVLVGGCRFGFGADTRAIDAEPDLVYEDAGIDAARSVPPADAGSCEPTGCANAGGTCVNGACELVATSENALTCPDGMPCRLVCQGYRFCRDGVRCAGATWCEIECIGYRACQHDVDCADAVCAVTCDGEEACEDGITTGAAAVCTVHCCGEETCAGGIGTCSDVSSCS